MTCSLISTLMEPYCDGELDANRQALVAEHLGSCAECTERYRELTQLRAALRDGTLYYKAPDALRTRVTRMLRNTEHRSASWRWVAVAALVLLMLSLTTNLVLTRRNSAGQEIASEILAEHVRSMMRGHLMEVASQDRHTVKPWFAGRLDFSPDVKDLAPLGFPLVGGRVDYINGRTVAALIFHRNQHVITLFTWPTSGRRASSESEANGYHVIAWEKDAMTYWAVSDLNQHELQSFAELYRR